MFYRFVYRKQGDSFFIQIRPGKDGKLFSIFDCRTMNDKKDSQGYLLSDAMRLTALIKIVRKTSLSEIPQLINVSKGDMSLLGSRPLKTLEFNTPKERFNSLFLKY